MILAKKKNKGKKNPNPWPCGASTAILPQAARRLAASPTRDAAAPLKTLNTLPKQRG
jgi:hypothetical protein